MSIQSLMTNPGHPYFYEEGWRNLIDQHVEYLLNQPRTVVQNIDPKLGYRFESDLRGYLAQIKVSPHLFYIVLKMNGFKDGSEFGEQTGTLYLPDEQDADKLMAIYRSSYL